MTELIKSPTSGDTTNSKNAVDSSTREVRWLLSAADSWYNAVTTCVADKLPYSAVSKKCMKANWKEKCK